MKNIKTLSTRIGSGFAALLLIASYFALLPTQAGAAQITNRSLTLQAGVTDGGAKPSGVVNHFFAFTVPGNSVTVGSILFEYCTTATNTPLSPTCIVPTGVSTDNVTMGSESGVTGFSAVDGDAGAGTGKVYLTRTAAAIAATPVAVSYRLDGVVNPSDPNETFFVRISTFASTDATGSAIDTGTVTASTALPIELSGTMPESLVFCAAETITTSGGGVPDCSTATDGDVEFNQLFSPTDTATASSQMAASTNAGQGYVITVNGTTLTSGANTIAPMSTAFTSTKGIGQFGLNLKLNTTATSTVAVGAEIAPVSDGTNLKAQALAGYEVADTFKFSNNDPIANSGAGGLGGTDAQIYTISYIANVPGNQPAGTYSTTLTYICTPTF